MASQVRTQLCSLARPFSNAMHQVFLMSVLAVVCPREAVSQAVFKCTTPEGETAYSTSPCSGGDVLEGRWVRDGVTSNEAHEGITMRNAGTVVFSGDPISISEPNMSVRVLMRLFSDYTGLNFVVSDAVPYDTFDIRYTNVPWDQVLDEILKKFGLVMSQTGNVIHVGYPGQMPR